MTLALGSDGGRRENEAHIFIALVYTVVDFRSGVRQEEAIVCEAQPPRTPQWSVPALQEAESKENF